MSFETKAMEKNPVVKTAKRAMSLLKNKIIISLMMLVTGILFLVAPSGNMNGTVVAIAVIVILLALINTWYIVSPGIKAGKAKRAANE